MRNPLKRLARRDPDKPTLRERAAALRASAAKVLRRRANGNASVGRSTVAAFDIRADSEDAELLALGRKFDEAHAEWLAAVAVDREPQGRLAAALEAAKARGGPTAEDFVAAWKLPGVQATHNVEEECYGVAGDLALDILARPARTIQGVALQARAVIVQVWPRGNYEEDAELGDDEDMNQRAVRALIESCCALAGVDWRRNPVASNRAAVSSNTVESDPVHAAIAAHRAAYAEWGRLSAARSEMRAGTPEHAATGAAIKEPLRREMAAFDALLATRATTANGLRLLIEYLPGAMRQAASDGGNNDEQRALDAIRSSLLGLEDAQRLVSEPRSVVKLPPTGDLMTNAIMKEWAAYVASDGTPEGDAASDRAFERRTALLKAIERLPATKNSLIAKALALALIEYVDLWEPQKSRDDYATGGRLAFDLHAIVSGEAADDPAFGYAGLPDPALVTAGFDVEALSPHLLRALHETADLLGELAEAILCQPRCVVDDGGIAPTRNEVGQFVDWIASITGRLANRARTAARGRRPDGDDENRLAVLAYATVTNGEPAEMMAFASDLQAEAGRLARG